MPQEADMARLPLETRVVPAVESSARRGLVEVGIDDRHAVKDDLDPTALDRHLLSVPLARRTQGSAAGRDDPVNRAVELARLEAPVEGRAVVEDLELQAGVGGVAFKGSKDGEPVVGPGRQLELEPEHEFGELAGRVQVAARELGTDDDLFVLGRVALGVARPAVEVASVKKRHEPLGGLGLRQLRRGAVARDLANENIPESESGCRGPGARSGPAG